MSTTNELVNDLIASAGLPKYIYQAKEFNPEKDTVLYSGPFWNEKEVAAGINSFLTGRWLVSGENVAKFQAKFGRRFNVEHCHMVNSGSSANLILITAIKKRLGWNDGDEIIVSPVGFPTTIAPIVQNNMKPVFVDIEMDTLNFDITRIRQKITDKTRAIFVSPVLGNPPDMDYLAQLCSAFNIKLIGDNCDSLGSKWDGKQITDYYYAWSTSFYPAHHISTGEGGMVCSNDSALIDLARSFSWWGRDCYCVGSGNLIACGTCGNRFDTWLEGYNGQIDHKYYFTNMGYNLKPLDMQGAIGIEQLAKLDEIDEKRRANFKRISALFEKCIPGVRVATTLPKADPSYFGVAIITETQELKEKLQAFLEENRIQTRNYFAGNLLLHPGYKHLDDAKRYPNSNLALSNVFFVGCYPGYSEKVFEYYEQVLQKWNWNPNIIVKG